MAATNLPADLPENWQQGQIVSPNGTDVGLTEQHGYNYMAKQINDTQEAMNTHTADTTNPHEATAEQVGAYPSDRKPVITGSFPESFAKQGIYIVNPAVTGMPTNGYYWHVMVFLDGANRLVTATQESTPYKTFYKIYNGGSIGWSNWVELANAANFLPLDGSVAMTGNIRLDGNILQLSDEQKYGNGVYFDISEQSKGARLMARRGGKNRLFYFNANEVPLSDALNMWYYDDGTERKAAFFGEHNTQLLATTIQSLIQGGSISMIKSVQRDYNYRGECDRKNGHFGTGGQHE